MALTKEEVLSEAASLVNFIVDKLADKDLPYERNEEAVVDAGRVLFVASQMADMLLIKHKEFKLH